MTTQTQKKYLTEYQEWVDVQGDVATIGLTPDLLQELEEIVYVELPHVGVKVGKEDRVLILETTKAAIDLYAPLSGEISAVNTSLKETPQLINEDPAQKGWLYKVKLSDQDELSLLTEA